MNDKPTEDNVIRIIASNDEPAVAPESTIPQYEYEIVHFDGSSSKAHGFLLFTSQHVAVMRDNGEGAIPVLVYPLDKVKYATIVEDNQADELPF
jgi:hypothetical protein